MHESQLGYRLKQCRVQKQMTLKQVGSSLNLDPSAISKYENGKRVPSLDTIKDMATLYQVELTTLIGQLGSSLAVSHTYQVRHPLIERMKLNTFVLFIVYAIGMMVYGFLDTEPNISLYQALFIPMGLLVLLMKTVTDYLFRRSGAYKTINLTEKETLYIEHPEDEATIQKRRRFDFFAHSFTLIIVFILAGFFVVIIDHDEIDAIASVLLVANIMLLLVLILMTAFKLTDNQSMRYDDTNRFMNRLKYHLYFIVSLLTSSFFFMFFPFFQPNETRLRVIIYILMLGHLGITWIITYDKHLFYLKYKLTKK